MTRSELRLLGSPRIERGGAPLEVDTRKALALVAYLAVTGQPQTRDALAGLLWPEYGQGKARAALRRTLSALQLARSDGWLVADRETVALAGGDMIRVDLDEFHARLAECRTHGHPEAEVCPRCLGPLGGAAAIYRGDFMAGFGLRDSVDFDDWQLYQSEGLRGELAGALDRLARGHGALWEWEPAIAHARRRLALDHLHEPAHAALMRLYALADQRSAAIRQYRECVRLLQGELGVPPLEETTALYRAVKEEGTPPLPDEGTPQPAREGAAASRPSPPPDGPLVGRAAEWEALLRAYEAAGERGHVAVLEGEAGIGKTRLAEEFLGHARSRGAGIVAARCYADQANLAYGPFFEGLSAVVDRPPGAPRLEGVNARHLGEAARLLPGLAVQQTPAPPLDTPGARSRFFEGVGEVLLAVCNGSGPGSIRNPGILFLDDLHWADESSLDLLAYLARRLAAPGGRPLLVLLAWRAEEVPPGHRLRGLLAEVGRAGAATHVPLGRLDRDAVSELARSATGEAPGGTGEQLGERLYGETEGLPLFLSEYLEAISRGALGTDDDAAWALPGGARDLLEGRLRSVSETGWQLLTAAAVLGRSFDFDAVREASGRGEEEAVGAIEELVARGILHEVHDGGEPVYDFSHDKLRSLVHEETSLARQRLLHRRVAGALAGRVRGGREPGLLAGRISHHYRLAGLDAEAAEYSRLAGDHARSIYANGDALAHYGAALALGHPRAGELHEAIGDLHTLLGEYAAALTDYEAAAALLDGGSLAGLEHKLGNVHARRGDRDVADSHYEAALAAFEEPGNTSGREGELARLHADWSLLEHRRGETARARGLAEKALELADAAGDARALTRARNVHGIIAAGVGDLETARLHLGESLALAGDLGDPDARVAALNNLALVHRTGGETDRAIELTGEALALCASVGDRHREAALRNNLADLLHAAGREGESMEQLKKAVAIFAEIGEDGALRPEIWKLSEW